jgi:hypothetical protein
MAVFAAAELALQTHPLGHDDFLGVDPSIVGVALGLEYSIDELPLFRSKTHGLLTPFRHLKPSAAYNMFQKRPAKGLNPMCAHKHKLLNCYIVSDPPVAE